MVGDGTAIGGGGMGEEQWVQQQQDHYMTGKTSVWWDIENCQVPKGCDPHAIAQNISSALVKMNYRGPVSISAYGDTNRIPTSVQHALSSTGIALNHVPAGVKDASDKKILVDMLFWAVDNPAPANYLLISGDRDFSNALHQLRMRRYNILLAQPLKASAALVAAAKCVWHWTSLVYGGFPFTSGDHSSAMQQEAMMQHLVYDNIPSNQPAYATGAPALASPGQKFSSPGRIVDTNFKVISGPQSPNQANIATMTSLPDKLEESKELMFSQNESIPAKSFMKAPHEFFGATLKATASSRSTPNIFSGNIDASSCNTNNRYENSRNQFIHPVFLPDNLTSPNSQSNTGQSISSMSSMVLPDVGKVGVSDYSSFFQNEPVFSSRGGEDSRLKSMSSVNPSSPYANDNNGIKCMNPVVFSDNADGNYVVRPERPISSPSALAPNNMPMGGAWGSRGSHPPPPPPPPPPPQYVQGLIGVILLALNTLKLEKIAPTETNIADCIRYGDPKYRNTDVRMALECALQQKMIVKQHLGKMELYVGRLERLWTCENPIGGTVEQYPKPTWVAIQKFLTSAAGRCAIIASECRYEAALVLKNSCLRSFSLGEVLRILNMIITMKKWIKHAHSGWQPVTITISSET